MKTTTTAKNQKINLRNDMVVLDNAKYQRCEHVMGYARQLGIELLFLPSYSPNLNLIERRWKLIQKKCLYSKYYSRFSLFKSAIMQCITDLPTKYPTRSAA